MAPEATPVASDNELAGLVVRVDDPADALTPTGAVHELTIAGLQAVLHPQFSATTSPSPSAGDPPPTGVLTTGLGASPGAAVGRVVRSADDALDAADRGERVILATEETNPADVHGMAEAAGILTSRGGLASHAAVVARGWGIPAVVGAAEVDFDADGFNVGDTRVAVGDTIAIDGTSGEVSLGGREVTSTDDGDMLIDRLLGWLSEAEASAPAASEGHTKVRTNADTAPDAATALGFGAAGVGLCRTEHQFLGERLPLLQDYLLAPDTADRDAALAALHRAQVDDFTALLAVMDGLPVTVRLLDPPLHEFLPELVPLAVAEATGSLSDADASRLAAVRELAEKNPMMGVRGVRLGIVRPQLYQTQIEALLRAAGKTRAAGGAPQVEIMVPFVTTVSELALVKAWVAQACTETGAAPESVAVGVMVETPRAALLAGELAVAADFLSFGTNDLTQMVWGLSRDDAESALLPTYLADGVLATNPFEHLDVDGVGGLVRNAVSAARLADPSIKIGVCGEHGGDPSSIRFFAELGLDYVSCSPLRVPGARLTLAQTRNP